MLRPILRQPRHRRMQEPRRRERRFGCEEGSTLLLTIFYGCLALVLILIAIAATSLYLERKRLFTVADSAALAGAEAFDLDQVVLTGAVPRVSLNSAKVAAAVARHLSGLPASSFESLTVERAESKDGRSATVSLSTYWRPPVLSLLLPEGLRIQVTVVARSVFF